MQSVPQFLQPILWSADVNHLDLQKDKVYIIHQILAYGSLEEWQWLYKAYSKKVITDVFVKYPYKDYRDARFVFVKNFLLHLEKKNLDERHYVKNIPRDLR